MLAFFSCFVMLGQAPSEISAAYERSASIGKRAQEAFVGGRIETQWLDNGKLRYAKSLPKGKKETFEVDLETAKVAPTEAKIENKGSVRDRLIRRFRGRAGARGEGFTQPTTRSPDGKTTAFVREDNVWIRTDGKEKQLTKDGTKSDGYRGRFYWSPNSKRLIALKNKRGGDRKVTIVETAPKDQLQPKTKTYDYLKPGDPIPLDKPHLFDVENGKEIAVSDELFSNPWRVSHERWDADSKRFTFLYNQRGHTVMRIVALDADSGKASVLMEEPIKTFFDYNHKQFYSYLPSGDFLWMSERNGWNHLYLFDGKTGKEKQQITKGEWVVLGVERVDDKAGLMWFRGSGHDPKQDPYHVHFGTAKLDGSCVTWLTQGDGTHDVQYSTDRKFLVDTWSRVDHAPVAELRDAVSGKLIKELDRGTLTELESKNIPIPERFVAKARDGKTDIWGIIIRPSNFDPKQKYPIIENIYAGPQGHFVPKSFRSSFGTMSELAELGFIVVQIDGLGTSNRSKAFHDVCWKNLGDSGLPDRVIWIKEAAKTRPWMDTSRVGIYGGSAGGQSSTRAMLTHGDFYKVCVSDCGCHDNRMDKIWWNELWMSWPIGPHYAEQSNVTQAHKLKGKLMLVVGELDNNVDPASTMQVAAALVKANKDFDLLIIPGAGHGACESPYGRRKRKDFFVRHLLGVTPPAWN